MKRLLLPLLLMPCFAQAQVDCADLQIESFGHAPFGSGLHVWFHNGSTELLGYPYFDLLDANGDTLIPGGLNSFGILAGTSQLYTMSMPFPAIVSPFSGSLVLHYSSVDGDYTCTYPLANVDLCPAEPCAPLQVYAYGNGTSVNASLAWTVTDPQNNEVATGGLQLNVLLPPTAQEDLCLPPGFYTLNISQPFPTGEAITVGVTTALFQSDGPSGITSVDGTLTLPFIYYLSCIDGTQGIHDATASAPVLMIQGRTMSFNMQEDRMIGPLAVIDAMGRTIMQYTFNSSTATFDLGNLAPGAYSLRSLQNENTWPAQRFLLP